MNSYESVWDAIMDTPVEAARMKARSEMMIALKCTVADWNVTQGVAAQRLGVTQPRLNDLLKGRLSKFSMDALFDLAAAAGLRPSVTVHVAGTRKRVGGRIGDTGSKQTMRAARPKRQPPKGVPSAP